MKPVNFLPAALEDIRREKTFYRTINPELARRFQFEVEQATASISEHPLAMEKLEFEIRRWPLGAFPHGLLYRVEEESVLVIAVFHPSQTPEEWQLRARR
ncbi:MAG: type II toxin-antitoxin system RelE/ParE family toxin [Gammaproteobacteria bacterium]|nr:type II toxin-antitoxin system RelE/ParE family toxin [Gammaproteobacteria bacterium]